MCELSPEVNRETSPVYLGGDSLWFESASDFLTALWSNSE